MPAYESIMYIRSSTTITTTITNTTIIIDTQHCHPPTPTHQHSHTNTHIHTHRRLPLAFYSHNVLLIPCTSLGFSHHQYVGSQLLRFLNSLSLKKKWVEVNKQSRVNERERRERMRREREREREREVGEESEQNNEQKNNLYVCSFSFVLSLSFCSFCPFLFACSLIR